MDAPQRVKQTIKRAAHDKDNPYFMMRRKTAQDVSLSLEARGMLAYILSKPDDWGIDPRNGDLLQGIGRDKMYSILKELYEAGYISKEPIRNERGWVVAIDYTVHENPLTPKPDTDLPDTEKPDAIHNTEEEQNTDNTSSQSAKAPAKRPQSKQSKRGSWMKQAAEERARNPVWDVVAELAFGTSNQAAVGRIANIVNGSNKMQCVGLIPYEMERQCKTREELDLKQISIDARAFWTWFTEKHPNLSLKDCNKWLEYWSEWRNTADVGAIKWDLPLGVGRWSNRHNTMINYIKGELWLQEMSTKQWRKALPNEQ